MEEWGDHTVDDDRMFMKTFNNPIVLGIYIYALICSYDVRSFKAKVRSSMTIIEETYRSQTRFNLYLRLT
jgi:hypothetical protein